ncbi:MAG: hypothetical protein E6K17_02810 [Methanobacteriota archaeon]|nr:MAG: hypothetical protein E6K17_02810 [Euryarchaeota archaeon]
MESSRGKGFTMRTAHKTLAFGLSVALLVLVLVIVLPAPTSADSVGWTSDTDWQSGFMDGNIVLKGTGPAAWLELRKGDFPDWEKMAPGTVPPARDGACLVWIDVDNSFLMFGGGGTTGLLSDTWKYNFTNDRWTQLSPGTSPGARTRAGCAYDPHDRIVLMFGGFDGAAWSTQTWKYDAIANDWSQLTPTGIPPRNLQTTPVSYDYQHRKFVMAGGNTVTNLFETWAYDYVANSWALRTTGGPGVRDGHGMAYNNATDRTLLFSGGSITGPMLFCDTWNYAYSSNTWTFVRTCIPNEDPNARVGHGMIYRDSYAGVLMFGGKDITSYPPETWVWLEAVSDWYLPLVTATPGGRENIQLAHSPRDDASLLFGGYNSGVKNDTWALAKGYVVNVDAIWNSSLTPVDTGCTNPVYNHVYWNSTANPLGAILRFQIATSNNPSGPWTFTGPGGFPGSHYTTWGQQIDGVNNGKEYFRMQAKLKTVNGRVTPKLEDLQLTWTCPPTAPYIKNTNPASGQSNVPIAAPVWVNFSEPMNIGTVLWTISGGITATASWSNGNRTLKLTPTTPFRDCTSYTAQITAGKDVNDNLDLVPGPVPNPWSFTTICINPYILSTRGQHRRHIQRSDEQGHGHRHDLGRSHPCPIVGPREYDADPCIAVRRVHELSGHDYGRTRRSRARPHVGPRPEPMDVLLLLHEPCDRPDESCERVDERPARRGHRRHVQPRDEHGNRPVHHYADHRDDVLLEHSDEYGPDDQPCREFPGTSRVHGHGHCG